MLVHFRLIIRKKQTVWAFTARYNFCVSSKESITQCLLNMPLNLGEHYELFPRDLERPQKLKHVGPIIVFLVSQMLKAVRYLEFEYNLLMETLISI